MKSMVTTSTTEPRRLPLRGLCLAALASLAMSVGCAPAGDGGDGASGADAITAQEAAKQFTTNGPVPGLENVPASPANVTKLGIEQWHVYESVDEKKVGHVVAFATDSAKDVRYALVLDSGTGKAAVLQYDKDGVKADQNPAAIPQETMSALLVDFAMLRDKANQYGGGSGVTTQAMSAGAQCGVRVAAAALGAAVLIGAGWWALSAIASWTVEAEIVGTITEETGDYAAYAGGVGIGLVGSAAVVTWGVTQMDKTVSSCSAAIHGS
jgi:hypothetical protein